MSREEDAFNAHIIAPELVESVLEGLGRQSIHSMLLKSVLVYHCHSATTLWLKQFPTVFSDCVWYLNSKNWAESMFSLFVTIL